MSAKPNGTFAWADLLPDEQPRAIEFYSELGGWTAAVGGPEFGGYALAFAGGEEGPAAMVAGLNPGIKTIEGFYAARGETPPNPMTPAWTIYLATDDIDATLAAVAANGGRELQPRMDIPNMGSSALCADPSGAAFGLWQGSGHHGFGVFGEPGAFCWTEVYSTDAAATRDFFVALFGMQSLTLRESPEFTYFQLVADGQDTPTFGVMAMPESLGDAPSHFGAYLFVSGVDAAVERVPGLGGAIVKPAVDTPFGRMATIADSEGALVNLVDPPTATGSM